MTVGGGFFGAVISTDTLFAAKNTPVFGYAMIALVIALYTYGIFAGIRLSEDASHYGHVLFFYALQRTRPSSRDCNPRVPWVESLSFGR